MGSLSNLKKTLLPVTTFAKISVRSSFRDKTAIFFVFLFPLIFLFIFGNIFGGSGDVSFRVAMINQSDTEFARRFVENSKKQAVLKIDAEADTLEEASEKMKRGQLDTSIILPPEFGQIKPGQPYPSGEARVLYTQNNEQAGQTLASILQEQFKGINAQFVSVETPFTVRSEQSNDKALRQFDYTFAGLLGFSILGLGIFGPVNYFPEMKKQGVLRRLHTTPLRVWQFFVSSVLSQSVIGLLSMALMIVVSMVVFDLRLAGNLLELAVYLVLGIGMVFGIGLAVGGWAKDQNQAAPLANIITFPMMFLSGTFFPRFLMPDILQRISNFLPLTPVIEGVRLIATEGKHLTELGPQIGLILGWTVIIYLIAFRSFRWE